MSDAELAAQVRQWHGWGCAAMKIKIGESWGTRITEDLRRVELFAELAGPTVTTMVDANGAYRIGQARRVGRFLDDLGVLWFEEPVSSDDLAGLVLLRSALRCDVAAGEYLAEISDAAAMVPVVDCLQLDATRCGGYTGWLRLAALAQAANLQVSAHCAPALHAPVAAAVPHLRHIEYFADHVALEPELADGVPSPADGMLPVGTGPGHGMTLREG
jgi:L-alanine-DL-glutamate epimerase-like enolase superfamily enzyme